jgi:hypothetical protein
MDGKLGVVIPGIPAVSGEEPGGRFKVTDPESGFVQRHRRWLDVNPDSGPTLSKYNKNNGRG